MCSITKRLEKLIFRHPVGRCWYGKYYKKMVENEVSLGEITEQDNVLCIGGGAMPCTAVEIHRRTGAKVLVIDTDPIAVKKASVFINNLQLNEYIEVMQADGQTLTPNKFSVIHLARQVFPREKVLGFLWDNVSEGTRILVREPKEALGIFYSPIKSTYWRKESVKKIPHHTIKGTLLLVKEKGRELNEKMGSSVIGNNFSSRSTLNS
jgi:hypothetical protein